MKSSLLDHENHNAPAFDVTRYVTRYTVPGRHNYMMGRKIRKGCVSCSVLLLVQHDNSKNKTATIKGNTEKSP